MAKITLNRQDLYEVADALVSAYRNSFDSATISRANEYVEGQSNPSRSFMWAVIMNTKGKAGLLCDVYSKKTAESLVKLTIYGLNKPKPESKVVDVF